MKSIHVYINVVQCNDYSISRILYSGYKATVLAMLHAFCVSTYECVAVCV